jgi:hypothetical protein
VGQLEKDSAPKKLGNQERQCFLEATMKHNPYTTSILSYMPEKVERILQNTETSSMKSFKHMFQTQVQLEAIVRHRASLFLFVLETKSRPQN